MIKRPAIFLFCFLGITPLLGAEEATLPFDHSAWDQFVKKVVDEKGEVDYVRAKEEVSLLDRYLEKLKTIPNFPTWDWPREERLAVLINAYNASLIKKVVDRYPVKTVNRISGVWELPIVTMGVHSFSLNSVQKSLINGFRDEKIIFALCSGAQGSPPLRREAYVASKIDGQLYEAARDFVNDAERNQIVPGEKKVVLSRLFKWNASSFLLNWGDYPEEAKWNPAEIAVLSFVAHYLQDPARLEFLKEGEYKVKYADFDWGLNQTGR